MSVLIDLIKYLDKEKGNEPMFQLTNLVVDKEKLKTAKIISCPLKNFEPVCPINCSICEFENRCAASQVPIGLMANFLPHENRHLVYDIFIPKRQTIDFNKSDRLNLWIAIISLFKNTNSIIDLGCGTGRFAKFLKSSSFKGKYLGLDFSENRIKIAKKYVPEYKFEIADVFTPEVYEKFNDFDVILLIELLQQTKDIKLIDELLENIPLQKRIIFTEPLNEDKEMRWSYHKDILDIDYMQRFDNIQFFLFRAQKKQ